MKKNTKAERSMFTTIIAAVVGIAVLGFTLLLLPINGFWEGATFGAGLLVTFVFAVTAYEGEKGTLLEAFDSLFFWR